MADAPIQNNIFNGQSLQSMAVKVIPAVSTLLVMQGVITKDQSNTLIQGAPDFINVAEILLGAAGYGFTIVWNFWKNRISKRVADTAAIPGVDVSAPAELAAKASNVATADAKSSIVAKAA